MVWGPSIVFSLVTLVAAFVVMFLPETNNKNLMQVVDDPTPIMERVELHNEKADPRCVSDSQVLLQVSNQYELQLKEKEDNRQASFSLCKEHALGTTT